MDRKISRPLKSEAKTLLLVTCACAFLSILATFDISEHHRAWRSATTWTDAQRSVAPALDADSIKPLILAALVNNTIIIALSFTALLILGIFIASDDTKSLFAVKVIVWSILSLGFILVLLLIVYKIKLGSRLLLKGPIYDYNLRLQPPLLLSLVGYPLVIISAVLSRLPGGFRGRPSRD
ncbi:MAG: hypothetical protein RBT72_03400 [Spirochaetia bacterium]|nr:hypothetical protein [Spirochaetia bacterium]